MIVRTHLIENDIKLFLETTPDVFLSTIKKRIKTWQTARDGFGRNFLDLLVYQLAIHHSKSANFWVDIFDKLDKLDFQFKSFHYFPTHELSERVTPMSSPDMAFHQKELLLGLIHRNVPFEKKDLEVFIKSQHENIDESLMSILKTLSPIDDILMFTLMKNNIKHLVDDVHEHSLIENPSVETQMEVSAIKSILSQFQMMNGDVEDDTLDNYLKLQAEKRASILSYLDSASLTKKQALELLREFHPCGSVMIDLDRRTNANYSQMLLYFDKVRKNHLLPRQYFTKLQLELMDVIQTKFNVQILE